MEAGRSSDPADWDAMYGEVKGMHVWRDMLCLPCMPKHLMDDVVDNFKFQEGDVILLSYPQSSFFWLQEVIWHLHNLDTVDVPIAQKPALATRLPFLEHEFKNADPAKILNAYKPPRLIKSHLPYRLLEKQLRGVEDKVKIILWTLDPKDVVPNYHNMWNNVGAAYFNFPHVTWEHFFNLFRAEKLYEGDWFDMNLSWVNRMGGKSNFLQLSHEETKARPLAETVRHVADFCGTTVTDTQVEKILGLKEYDVPIGWKTCYSDEQKQCVEQRCREKLPGTSLEKYCA